MSKRDYGATDSALSRVSLRALSIASSTASPGSRRDGNVLSPSEAKRMKAAFDRRGKAEYGEGYYLWKHQIHDVIDSRTQKKGAKRRGTKKRT